MTAASKRVDETRSSDPPVAEPLTSSAPLDSAGPGRDDALRVDDTNIAAYVASYRAAERSRIPRERRSDAALVGGIIVAMMGAGLPIDDVVYYANKREACL